MTASRLISLLLATLLLASSGPARAEVLCPLTNEPYSAELEPGELTATAGQPTFVTVRLDPSEPPPGYTVSTLVETVKSPLDSKPDVVPGFPRIRLTFAEPGSYFLKVRVNLITKSSCGGVEAAEVLQTILKAEVSPK